MRCHRKEPTTIEALHTNHFADLVDGARPWSDKPFRNLGSGGAWTSEKRSPGCSLGSSRNDSPASVTPAPTAAPMTPSSPAPSGHTEDLLLHASGNPMLSMSVPVLKPNGVSEAAGG